MTYRAIKLTFAVIFSLEQTSFVSLLSAIHFYHYWCLKINV